MTTRFSVYVALMSCASCLASSDTLDNAEPSTAVSVPPKEERATALVNAQVRLESTLMFLGVGRTVRLESDI